MNSFSVGAVWTQRSRAAAGVEPSATICGALGFAPRCRSSRREVVFVTAEGAIADGDISDVCSVEIQPFVLSGLSAGSGLACL